MFLQKVKSSLILHLCFGLITSECSQEHVLACDHALFVIFKRKKKNKQKKKVLDFLLGLHLLAYVLSDAAKWDMSSNIFVVVFVAVAVLTLSKWRSSSDVLLTTWEDH